MYFISQWKILYCTDQDCTFACENESFCKTGQRTLGSCFDAKMNQLDILITILITQLFVNNSFIVLELLSLIKNCRYFYRQSKTSKVISK